jgi:hypothetical protein
MNEETRFDMDNGHERNDKKETLLVNIEPENKQKENRENASVIEITVLN